VKAISVCAAFLYFLVCFKVQLPVQINIGRFCTPVLFVHLVACHAVYGEELCTDTYVHIPSTVRYGMLCDLPHAVRCGRITALHGFEYANKRTVKHLCL
jgi:hypothetical protein